MGGVGQGHDTDSAGACEVDGGSRIKKTSVSRIIEQPRSNYRVEVIKALGIEYVAANPGAITGGIHESIINHGGNRSPEWLACCHEESAVAMRRTQSDFIWYLRAPRSMPKGVYPDACEPSRDKEHPLDGGGDAGDFDSEVRRGGAWRGLAQTAGRPLDTAEESY